MSVGLMGAPGTLDIDGLTVELIGVGGADSTNLIVNGDFELGDPAPYCWAVEKDAKRVFPGFNSSAALELRERNSRAQAGLAIAVEPFEALEISMAVRASGPAGRRRRGRRPSSFSTISAGPSPARGGEYFLTWSDSFDWRVDTAYVRGAARGAPGGLQIDKTDRLGAIRLDDVQITASPNPAAGSGRRSRSPMTRTSGWRSAFRIDHAPAERSTSRFCSGRPGIAGR